MENQRVSVSNLGQMDVDTKVNGSKANQLVRGSRHIKMERRNEESGKVVFSLSSAMLKRVRTET